MTFLSDLKFAYRSLARSKGLTFTVVVTLALGIGANAAIFSLVRGVLLRPLVNRDEDRLVYIRQSAPGLQIEDAAFSVPEILDLKSRVTTLSEFGDFSTIGFTMVGLGEPREVRSGVVGGSYFDVMGLHPVLGRLLGPADDGPSAAGACVLTYRFWMDNLKGDTSVLGKTIRLGERTATIVGVLEPSVPYPAETEIIANIVTSPHHLSATMVQGRVHRMTELFGRLKPGTTIEAARAELTAAYQSMVQQHPEAYSPKGQNQDHRREASRADHVEGQHGAVGAPGGVGVGVHHRLLQCGEPGTGADGAARRRTGDPRGAGREFRRFAADAAGGKPTAVRRRRGARRDHRASDGGDTGALCVAVLGARARFESGFQPAVGGGGLAVVASVLLAYVPRLPLSGTAHGFGRGAAARALPAARRAACECSRWYRSPRRSCCWWAPPCC